MSVCPKCQAVIDEDVKVCPQCRFILVGDDDTEESEALPEDLLSEGFVLGGDYRIVRTIGMGGAGVVYEARQLSLDNMPVAVKVLHPELNEDDTTISLLKKEVIIARELTHDNIMKVYSLERTDEKHFIVMEYVDGESLQAMLDKVGKISFEKAASYFVRICNALQYAHDRGVIHLDIKPANILVAASGHVKLCDFGIARMAFSGTTTATQRIITGSVGFMPPEQYKGRKFVSSRSDIFALGATIYAALTGEVPIGIIESEGIPQCVTKAMQRKPEQRFETVEEFKNAFLEETGYEPKDEERSREPITLTRRRREEQPTELQESTGEPQAPTSAPPVPEPVTERTPAPPTSPIPVEPAPTTQPAGTETVSQALDKPSPADTERVSAPGAGTGKRFPLMAVAAATVVVLAIGLIIILRGGGKAPGPPASDHKVSKFRTMGVGTSLPAGDLASLKEADPATAKVVGEALTEFVDLLNWDRTDQAYTFLSKELRDKLPREVFRSRLFTPPRLWRFKIEKIGVASDGTVVVKLRLKVSDAYRGATRDMAGWIAMMKKGSVWKIVDLSIG